VADCIVHDIAILDVSDLFIGILAPRAAIAAAEVGPRYE
jgi:hypothetical protein